jgi:hypothetical protein
MKRTDKRHLKTSATVLGGTALVAMGIIGALAGQTNEGTAAVVSDSMTTGATTTVTYSGTIAPVVAVPPVKATYSGES